MGDRSGRALVLIRSGRTAWDEAGRVQGGTDLPATAEGLADVGRALGEWVEGGGRTPGLVFCGEDEGSRETAWLAGEAFGAKVRAVAGLSAMGMGLWEGLAVEDLEERHRKSYRQWRDRPSSVRVPEGEGVQAFAERALGAVGRLLEKHPKKDVGLVLRPLEFAILDRVLPGGEAMDLTEEELAGVGEVIVERHVAAVVVREALEGLVSRA